MRGGLAQTRREFLERTAYAAGLAGMSAALPASTILAGAADAAGRASALPAPRNLPIDHFVVLMMENRSFDHYFGWLPGADGVQSRTYPDPDNGGTVSTHHASTVGWTVERSSSVPAFTAITPLVFASSDTIGEPHAPQKRRST